jgi:hypothetical protein
MKIVGHPLFDADGKLDKVQLTLEDKETIRSFQTLLNRALNTWPDAPPEWKELSDRIEHGKALQDYYPKV